MNALLVASKGRSRSAVMRLTSFFSVVRQALHDRCRFPHEVSIAIESRIQLMDRTELSLFRCRAFLRPFAWSLGFVLASHAFSANAAATPDLSGQWGRDMLFFEPPDSGPGPVNRAYRADGKFKTQTPCCKIVQSWFGDPNNPILRPNAAEAVKRNSELSVQGTVLPDLHSTCRPEPPPYVLGLHYGVLIVQQTDEVKLFYLLYNTVRRVRLNVPHRKNVTPSWSGDSVGHYERDELVIDTVGIKSEAPATVDAFGTPHSPALHVVERYRLIDGKKAAEAQEKNGAKYTPAPAFGRGVIDGDTRKNGLQVEFTVEDPVVFTTAWSGLVTYRRVTGIWPEAVCSENPHEYYSGRDAAIPQAKTPDF